MKISFQIIHNYQAEPLTVIGNALHLTLNEDLLIPNDFSIVVENLNIKLNKRLNCGDTLCYFEINVTDFTNYDEFRHIDFIESFVSRIKLENGFVKILKFNDDVRLNEYLEIYKDIASIEMKIREIFSFIFYSKYDDKNQDILEEFEVKIVNKEDVRKDDLEKKLENKFFYLTFSEYLKFDSPKDIPTKDVLPLIINNNSYDLLRTYISSRGIIQTNHLSFLRNVKNLLDPIESVRNCVAHNRKIPKNQLDNYPDAKQKLLAFIDNFWNEEIQVEQDIAE